MLARATEVPNTNSWPEMLAYIENAYNSRPHLLIGVAPFMLLTSHDINQPSVYILSV